MNQELRTHLDAGLDELAPKLADRILQQEIHPIASEAELFGEAQKTNTIRQMPPTERVAWRLLYRTVAGMAALFALIFCFREVRASSIIEGRIIVDVNPSVALSVNKIGRVSSVEALNADGVSIVDGLSKKRGSVENVLTSVFDSMETQDYLKSERAGVLVSYCYKQESAVVETKIQSAIVNLSGSRQNCTIYSQTFEQEDDAEAIAKTMGVSVGKYYFVNRIMEESKAAKSVSYDQTMEELVQFMDDQGVQVTGVDVYTGANDPGTGGGTQTEGNDTEDNPVQTTEMTGEPNGTSPGTEDFTQSPDSESSMGETQDPPLIVLPETEEPVVEIPDSEEPGTEGPEGEEAGTEEPESGEAGTEEPESGEAGTEEPESGEAGTEEPESEEPEGEETGTEEDPGDEDPKPEVDVSGLAVEWVQARLGDDWKIQITWDVPEQVSGYEVYYRNLSKEDYEKIADRVTGNVCKVTGLTLGRSYIFRIVPFLEVDGEKYYGEAQESNLLELVPESLGKDLSKDSDDESERESDENIDEPEDKTAEEADERADEDAQGGSGTEFAEPEDGSEMTEPGSGL